MVFFEELKTCVAQVAALKTRVDDLEKDKLEQRVGK